MYLRIRVPYFIKSHTQTYFNFVEMLTIAGRVHRPNVLLELDSKVYISRVSVGGVSVLIHFRVHVEGGH